jgi:hypothetical protein
MDLVRKIKLETFEIAKEAPSKPEKNYLVKTTLAGAVLLIITGLMLIYYAYDNYQLRTKMAATEALHDSFDSLTIREVKQSELHDCQGYFVYVGDLVKCDQGPF